MDESKRPVRGRRGRSAWRPLFPGIGLPLLGNRPCRGPQECPSSGFKDRLKSVGSFLTPEDSPVVHNTELSRFKLLSMNDLNPSKVSATDSGEKNINEGTTIVNKYGFDEDYGDPFLEDGFGNLTQWRLSDLNKVFGKRSEDELNEPEIKEKKQPKLEMLKWHNNRMEQYMKASLKKYNNEKNLDEDLHFEFVKGLAECLIVEGGYKTYRHFNFEAIQSGTSISLFFAEVIPHGEDCEVTFCKLLDDDDQARCHGCNNNGHPDLKHPACGNVYVGGHVDCKFPFLIDSDSEDDSD